MGWQKLLIETTNFYNLRNDYYKAITDPVAILLVILFFAIQNAVVNTPPVTFTLESVKMEVESDH